MAVPLELEDGAAASLAFFSHVPRAFSDPAIAWAQEYAATAAPVLRLAVRIDSKEQLAGDLQEAMKSRTAIDLAVGVIMGQHRCSQDEAFGILSRAASSRNQKLRQVAVDLLANLTAHSVETHFEK